MFNVYETEKSDLRIGGGRSQRQRVVNQQRVQAHTATRKGAGGNISTWELKRIVRVRILNPLIIFKLASFVINKYLSVIHRCFTCMMGMMGMFKWLRKDIIQRDRNRRTLSPKFDGLNNEAYRNALHAFIERRKNPNDPSFIVSPSSPDKVRLDLLIKRNYENDKNKNNNRGNTMIPGVPNAPAPHIFEIGWIAGTEDRYMELIYAEWHNTRVSLRRHIHPDCKNAVKADLEVLSEIRHPNVILLMATTQTEEHGLVAIFEPIDCTLFNYIHEQGERISVQGVAKCAGNLAAALKHAHMRGYIHSAISPHSIFLASSGIVKLGGWELATTINGPKTFREYEDRLRSEIFRWQAPELLSGHEASEACDIYSLTLLMWEMCTTNIPWNNLSKSEVERQYSHYRRGVILDLYNFPSLLNNLLEAGLQLDVTKRTLDMAKMSRYLQRLEMLYEDEDPIYIEQMTNNNNKPGTPEICKSPTAIKSPSVTETPKKPTRLPNQASIQSPKDYRDFTESEDILEEVLRTTSVQNANLITKNMRTEANKRDLKTRRTSCTEKAGDSTDEEIFSDPRVNIKKLKEFLANKRETFFYGSDNSSNSSKSERRDNQKSKLLKQIRSKDYEPHKPASHKTSIEPKLNKSPGQYGTYTKSVNIKTHKPYSYVPNPIRGAVIQPQILNPDSKSFFETSLWRKEKMICMSKMRRSNPEDYRPIDTTNCADKRPSPESNETYTINSVNYSGDGNQFTATDTSQDTTNSTIPRSKSLQALKDSLDRATDIIKSTTPNTSSTTPVPASPGSNDSSPFKSSKSFTDDIDNSAANESVFEELYKLNDQADDEIKSIERSGSGDTFVIDDKKVNAKEKLRSEDERDVDQSANCSFLRGPAGVSRTVFHCESISEKPVEQVQFKDREPETILHESATAGGHTSGCGALSHPFADGKVNPDEDNEASFTLFVFGDKSKEKGCFSCAKGNLARRRSLPAHLGQLRSLNNTPLGKIPIRRIDLPDNTVEDIYIDDEFGDSLAVNMVLLNEDDPTDDDDFLPDLLELSGSNEY